MPKSLVNYNINSDLLEKFEEKKGNFKKSNLVEFWIDEFVKGNKNFIPLKNKQFLSEKKALRGLCIASKTMTKKTSKQQRKEVFTNV